MLLTKAFITKLPDKGSNIYQVRVPLMEDNTQRDIMANFGMDRSCNYY